MSKNLDTAKFQLKSIGAALDGSSNAMQVMGNTERDENPVRMLAVGLAHAQNALAHLALAIEDLEKKVR
jgi:hypothetical protein